MKHILNLHVNLWQSLSLSAILTFTLLSHMKSADAFENFYYISNNGNKVLMIKSAVFAPVIWYSFPNHSV